MDPFFPDATASSVRIAGAASLRLELLQEAEEDRQAVKSRPRLWPVIVALLALAVMLPLFYQVVRGAMQQSEGRQKAEAQQAEALWRCNSLQGREAGNCQQRLKAEARQLAQPQSPQTP